MESEPNDGANESGGSGSSGVSYPDVPLLLLNFEETPPIYANDVYISTDPAGLQFVFTRFLPPPVLTEADRQRILDRGHYVHDVVARLVLPPVVAERLLRMLPERVETQQSQQSEYANNLRAEPTEEAGSDNG